MIEEIEKEINESIQVKKELTNQASLIAEVAEDIVRALKNNGKVILCGNGGSAADSQHIAAEMVGRFTKEREPFPAIALTTNTSILTAIGNDYSFDEIFVRQVKAFCNEKDVVIGISTSGNSTNVIKAMEVANKLKAHTIALTGKDGGNLAKVAKKTIRVPSQNTQRIQESHILIGHLICLLIEKRLFKK
ncbi:MAG: D-sedoheptulose-7-phosphate isomerase [Nitrosotalea sp.]